MKTSLRVAGIFAGIGGFERGLEEAGHETVQLCEIDDAARAVLGARFPGVEIVRDVRDLVLPADVDLVTAGFPCQDLSQAGRTNGIEGKRSGIVEALFAALRTAPTPVPWLLIENVPFMLYLKSGSAMEYLAAQLEALDYAWAYRVIDSRAFGLPQRRRRVYLLASLEADPGPVLLGCEAEPEVPESHEGRACGFYWTEGNTGLGWAIDAIPTLKGGSGVGIPSPPAVWMPDGLIGKPVIEDAERLQGFEAGWTAPAERVTTRRHRWKLLGNAVTVDVARWLGKRLADSRAGSMQLETRPMNGSWSTAGRSRDDGGREGVALSEWPVRITPPPLAQFLEQPLTPLSERATSGFLGRLLNSRLHYPEAFRVALEGHLAGRRGLKERVDT